MLIFQLFFTGCASGGGEAGALRVPAAPAPAGQGATVWHERFEGDLDWRSPSRHDARALSRVYSVAGDAGARFLRARHDATGDGAPGAMHFGHGFTGDAPRLDRNPVLRVRWRVRTHPAAQHDPWLDLAASVYVVMKQPTLLSGGRGFKLGWVSAPAPIGTRQRGLLQVPVRSDPASESWKTDEVDLCALYRRTYGPCEGEQVVYVGIVTDADDTQSVAEADYGELSLAAR